MWINYRTSNGTMTGTRTETKTDTTIQGCMCGRGLLEECVFLEGSITRIRINCKSNYAQIGQKTCRQRACHMPWQGCTIRCSNYATYAFFMAQNCPGTPPPLNDDVWKKCQQSTKKLLAICAKLGAYLWAWLVT